MSSLILSSMPTAFEFKQSAWCQIPVRRQHRFPNNAALKDAMNAVNRYDLSLPILALPYTSTVMSSPSVICPSDSHVVAR